MKHDKGKKVTEQSCLKQLVVLERYNVNIFHVLCDTIIALLFAIYP